MTNQDLQGRTIQARNPRTGEMDYSFEVTKNSEIEEIVSDLRSSQKAWSEKTIDQRAENPIPQKGRPRPKDMGIPAN